MLINKASPSQILSTLVMCVGKHGCDSVWRSLAENNASHYSFLLKEPSENKDAFEKNGRIIYFQSLKNNGIDIEWMVADEWAVDSDGNTLTSAGRWVIRNINVYLSSLNRDVNMIYGGELPFGLQRSGSLAELKSCLGDDYSEYLGKNEKRVTFFLGDGRSIELCYNAGSLAMTQMNVSFLGTSVPCIPNFFR